MKYIILLILLFACNFGFSNNWERVKRTGTTVYNIASDLNNIYCHTEGGFYKKQKNGNWEALNNNNIAILLGIKSFSKIINNTEIKIFSTYNKLLIFNPQNKKLISSSDEGLNWATISLPTITAPFHFFNYKNELYIQSEVDYTSVFCLRNNNWVNITTPKAIGRLSSLGDKILNTNNTNDLDNGFSIADSLFYFTDYTTSGLPIMSYHIISFSDTLFFYDIASTYFFNNCYYVLTSDGKIYKSQNNNRWQPVNIGLPNNILTIKNFSYLSDTLLFSFITNEYLTFYSVNNAQSWQKSKSYIQANLKFNDEYYAVDNGKLFKSNYIDSAWVNDLDSVYSGSIYNLQSVNEFIYFQDYSINRPVRYNTITNEFVVINSIDLHNNKIFSINSSNKIQLFLTAGYKLYYSVDTGINWSILNLSPFISKAHGIFSGNNKEIIFIASDSNDSLMILSLNDSLHLKNIGGEINEKEKINGFIRVNNKLYYNYYNILNIYSSNDNGQTWQLDNNGIQSGLNAYGLFAIDSQVLLYAGNANSIRTIFFIKGPNQWEKYTSNSITVPSGMILDFNYTEGTLYTNIPFSTRLYSSNDFGRNWNLIPLNGINYNFISSQRGITSNKQGIFIGSYGDGMYKHDLVGKTTFAESTSKFDFKIFPNPVKKHLQIDIEYPEKYTYEILDFNGRLFYSGKLSKQINLSELAKGYYILKIIYNEQTQSKIIVKE